VISARRPWLDAYRRQRDLAFKRVETRLADIVDDPQHPARVRLSNDLQRISEQLEAGDVAAVETWLHDVSTREGYRDVAEDVGEDVWEPIFNLIQRINEGAYMVAPQENPRERAEYEDAVADIEKPFAGRLIARETTTFDGEEYRVSLLTTDKKGRCIACEAEDCDACNATGAAACPSCQGKGEVLDDDDETSSLCENCAGSGLDLTEGCSKCNSSGVIETQCPYCRARELSGRDVGSPEGQVRVEQDGEFVLGIEWHYAEDGTPYVWGGTSGNGRGQNNPRLMLHLGRLIKRLYQAKVHRQLIVVGPFTPAGYAFARAFADEIVSSSRSLVARREAGIRDRLKNVVQKTLQTVSSGAPRHPYIEPAFTVGTRVEADRDFVSMHDSHGRQLRVGRPVAQGSVGTVTGAGDEFVVVRFDAEGDKPAFLARAPKDALHVLDVARHARRRASDEDQAQEPEPEPEFEVLSDSVVETGNFEAACLLHGNNADPERSMIWCTGKDPGYFNEYRRGGRRFVVLPDGPKTWVDVNGQRVPWAPNAYAISVSPGYVNVNDRENNYWGDPGMDVKEAVRAVEKLTAAGIKIDVDLAAAYRDRDAAKWKGLEISRERWADHGITDPQIARIWENTAIFQSYWKSRARISYSFVELVRAARRANMSPGVVDARFEALRTQAEAGRLDRELVKNLAVSSVHIQRLRAVCSKLEHHVDSKFQAAFEVLTNSAVSPEQLSAMTGAFNNSLEETSGDSSFAFAGGGYLARCLITLRDMPTLWPGLFRLADSAQFFELGQLVYATSRQLTHLIQFFEKHGEAVIEAEVNAFVERLLLPQSPRLRDYTRVREKLPVDRNLDVFFRKMRRVPDGFKVPENVLVLSGNGLGPTIADIVDAAEAAGFDMKLGKPRPGSFPAPRSRTAKRRQARTVRPTKAPKGVYYHGTSIDKVAKILDEGLKANDGAQFAPAVKNDAALHPRPAVYLTTWLNLALRYAEGLKGTNSEVAVIEVKLDPASVQPDRMDDPRNVRWPAKTWFGPPGNPMLRGQVESTQFLYEGDIPPSAIRAVYLPGGLKLRDVPSLAGEVPEVYEEFRSVFFQLKRYLAMECSWRDVMDVAQRVYETVENVDMGVFEDKVVSITEDYDQLDDSGEPVFKDDEDARTFDRRVEAAFDYLRGVLFTDAGVGHVVTDRAHAIKRYTPKEARRHL
jgi:hypothetical protein